MKGGGVARYWHLLAERRSVYTSLTPVAQPLANRRLLTYVRRKKRKIRILDEWQRSLTWNIAARNT